MLYKLPLNKILKTALKNGGCYSDIFFESTVETQITADNGRIEKIVVGRDVGLGIRVVYNDNTAYGYTNELTEKSVTFLAETVSQAVNGKVWNQEINLNRKKSNIIHAVLNRPDSVALKDKVSIVKTANDTAWKHDKRIQQASITYKDTIRSIKIANSLGEIVEDEKIDTSFLVLIVAGEKDVIQTGVEVVGGFSGFEFFDENRPEQLVEDASKRAIMMLSARPAPSGVMPVVLSADAGGTMIHEAVGHGLEADLALEGSSVYGKRFGEEVASPFVTVIDDATIPGKRGSFSFDDEGIPAQKNILIENGILKNYMYNRITAQQSGVESTGNGRRESYRFKPSVRMTNTIIKSGKEDPDSIIRSTDSGLLVKRMGGGQVNTITGDFVFEVQEAYLIKNGMVGDPVRGVTLTGNGPEVLKIIDKVGNDIGYAIGTCGKDNQKVPVADAQPTIRIPELIVGGTEA